MGKPLLYSYVLNEKEDYGKTYLNPKPNTKDLMGLCYLFM